MMIRCMAQFVGDETKYSSWNIFQNFAQIYDNEGAQGFFNGLAPRLIFEASSIGIRYGLCFLIKKYFFDNKKKAILDDLIDIYAYVNFFTIKSFLNFI